MENWKFSEDNFEAEGGIEFGSGYPSDPKCKEWLSKNVQDPFFGMCDTVRFSWAPVKTLLAEKANKIRFEADDMKDEMVNDQAQTSMASFVTSSSNTDRAKKARLGGLAVTNGFTILGANEFFQ